MRIAVMQPYFLPYAGYFQLIQAVDEFVVYDDIQYTKRGWINRNRFLQNGSAKTFTIALKKDSSLRTVSQRQISAVFRRDKLENRLRNAYARAPHFECFPLIREIIRYPDANLFEYVFHSIRIICDYLGVGTKLTVSSSIDCEQASLKSQEKVLSICNALGASQYINPIGGVGLYRKDEFLARGVELLFLRSGSIRYAQGNHEFISSLSIVDVMMYNPKDKIQGFLKDYSLE